MPYVENHLRIAYKLTGLDLPQLCALVHRMTKICFISFYLFRLKFWGKNECQEVLQPTVCKD